MKNNEQIFKKVISKAFNNGFIIENLDYKNEKEMLDFCDMVISDSLYNFIFSHDFAISFFGKDWKKHLQNMVIKKNPLDYLSRFCDNIKCDSEKT